MAGTHGGARSGSGRKKMSEQQKSLEGKSKAKPAAVKLKAPDIPAGDCPEPHAYMTMATKGAGENIAKQVYEEIYGWMKKRGCDAMVQRQLIEQYALSFSRYAQAETAIHQFGLLAKHPSTGNPVPSPFIEISQIYLKQSQAAWMAIYSLIKDVCGEMTDPDDVMEQILSGTWDKVNGHKYDYTRIHAKPEEGK